MIFFVIYGSGNKKFDDIRGNLILNNFQYKNKCLTCNNEFYTLNIDRLSSWFNIENETENGNSDVLIGKYKFEEKNHILYMNVTKAKPIFLNGNYLITIDTLYSSLQRDELAITFKSKTVFIKGYKNIVKKIGN
jgi:hypothetical protein